MQSRISEFAPENEDIVYKDVTPILSPDWNVNTSVEVEIIDNLFGYVSGRYLSESFLELTNDPSLIVPESFIVDLGVRYTILENFEIKVDLNNVFDELYYTNGAPIATAEGFTPGYFVQPPRNVFATLTMKF